MRGANIARGVPAGPTLARPSSAPKKTMEQLLAAIMAASGPPGRPSPPRHQPKNDYSTMNYRIVVTEYVEIARLGNRLLTE